MGVPVSMSHVNRAGYQGIETIFLEKAFLGINENHFAAFCQFFLISARLVAARQGRMIE